MSRGAATERPASLASSRFRRTQASRCSSTRTAVSDRRRSRWCWIPSSPAARTWCSERGSWWGVIPCTRRPALGSSHGSWPGVGECRSRTSARYAPSAWTCCDASTCRTVPSGGQWRWCSRPRCSARASYDSTRRSLQGFWHASRHRTRGLRVSLHCAARGETLVLNAEPSRPTCGRSALPRRARWRSARPLWPSCQG